MGCCCGGGRTVGAANWAQSAEAVNAPVAAAPLEIVGFTVPENCHGEVTQVGTGAGVFTSLITWGIQVNGSFLPEYQGLVGQVGSLGIPALLPTPIPVNSGDVVRIVTVNASAGAVNVDAMLAGWWAPVPPAGGEA